MVVEESILEGGGGGADLKEILGWLSEACAGAKQLSLLTALMKSEPCFPLTKKRDQWLSSSRACQRLMI